MAAVKSFFSDCQIRLNEFKVDFNHYAKIQVILQFIFSGYSWHHIIEPLKGPLKKK